MTKLDQFFLLDTFVNNIYDSSMENARDKKVNVVKGADSNELNEGFNTKDSLNQTENSTKSVEEKSSEVIEPTLCSEEKGTKEQVDSTSDKDFISFNTVSELSVKPEEEVKAGTTKTSKKGKKSKRQPVGTGGFVAICVTLSLVCAFLGGVGGYFLYNMIKPEVKYATSYSDFIALAERAEKNPNLLEEFKGEEYNIINVAYHKYTQHKHTLTLGYGLVDSVNGAQTVHAATIGGEGKAFNQNVSTTGPGAIMEVKTSFRFYYDITDPKNPTISAYEKKTQDQWTEDMKVDNTYDADTFIKKYGKLNYGEYIVNSDDAFVSLGNQDEGKIINGVSIYQINNKSVISCPAPTKNEAGNYIFNLKLKSNAACRYYVNQIKTNGDLSKNPVFTPELSYEVELNEDFELVSSYVKENYSIAKGPLNFDCFSTMKQRYFYSDDEKHTIEGKDVHIPTKGEKLPFEIDENGNLLTPEEK